MKRPPALPEKAVRYFRGPRWKEAAIVGDEYPFAIPAIRDLEKLRFDRPVTFLVGENGSGKSTLVEAIAVKAGFNPEGGSRNFQFATRASHSALADHIRLERGPDYMRDGYFLRAESFYNVATELEKLDDPSFNAPPLTRSYGGVNLHEQSHGESFFSLLNSRLSGAGFFVFDEPEAALSPQRQLAMLAIMHRLVCHRSQLLIATHSPILLAYPDAIIYLLDEEGIRVVGYEETAHYAITKRFLNDREGMLRILLEEDGIHLGGDGERLG